MAFHSFPFILVFLPLTVAGYYASTGKLARIWLIICSFVFYAWAGLAAVPILAASILFNFLISRRLDPEYPDSAKWLRIALLVNIAGLMLFKYSDFAVSNINAVFGTHITLPPLALPMGISFFTVQQIMFLVDRQQGVTKRQGFLDYTLFVSWFPYIVTGPITRWKEVVPQLQRTNASGFNPDNLARGLALFVLGLSKKVLIADAFAGPVSAGFLRPDSFGWLDSWLLGTAFMLQIYFDFSAYTDMARASALMMNVDLPENFNNPLWSLGIIEFWQRWHMTLTRFITNYMYMPMMRMGRPTFRKAMWATLAAMTIAGAWHGAAWTYVVFGAWHGLGLVVNNIWRKSKRHIPRSVSWVVTMVFLIVGFVFFRAATIGGALHILRLMLIPGKLTGPGLHDVLTGRSTLSILGMLAAPALLFVPKTAAQAAAQVRLQPRAAVALAGCAFFVLIVMNSTQAVSFIYRQF